MYLIFYGDGLTFPAILFSANPNPGPDVFNDSRLGNIDKHSKLAVKNGSVNWNLKRNYGRSGELESYYSKVKKGYIYNVPDKSVSYTCDINWIKRGDLLTPSDLKHTPKWRDSTPDPQWITLNIRKFDRLSKTDFLTCSDFKSYVTGKSLKSPYINNYLIVEEV